MPWQHTTYLKLTLCAVYIWLFASCNTTKHLADNQYLLRKNMVILSSDKPISNKGELKDKLTNLILQKPNTYVLFGKMPYKLWLYNSRYHKLKDKPDGSLTKSVERPTVFDTSAMRHSIQNMKGFLFNQSYYYAKITDTFIKKRKKIYATYKVNLGTNFLMNKEIFDVDDSDVKALMVKTMDRTAFQKNSDFSNSMAEGERSRLTTVARNNGYYSFSQDNIIFKIDTFDKTFFKDLESPFESAVNFFTATKSNKKPTLDMDVIIRRTDDTTDYIKYKVGKVIVYPDFDHAVDMNDSVLIQQTVDSIIFRYRYHYINETVLRDRIYIKPGGLFSQADIDKTRAKLNELGLFQFIRIEARVSSQENNDVLDFIITMNRVKRYDYGYNYALSSGSTYSLGHQLSFSYRDKNVGKGADLLTISANGGLEYAYDAHSGKNPFDQFSLLTRYYGLNGSLDFPKFLAPVNKNLFDNSSLPHTIVSVGENVMERVEYFNLVNTSASYSYKWRQNQSISWGLTPAFVNIIRLPLETDSFKKVLSTNNYLKNSYNQNLIEGENISFIFNNEVKKHGKNYTYIKLSLEEAGAFFGLLNSFGASLNNLFKIKYAEYSKFDFDIRHFIKIRKSVFATRLYGGIGIPYGQSTVLPYIKQYFAGGPYGLRGWRIRSLGPGSFNDSAALRKNPNSIDLTGDMKIETNGEYRFPIAPLFAGAIKMNGAFFADAGNIWLARPDTSYSGGQFQTKTLWHDIAMDAGMGLRFDISFITIRTDAAIILKRPYDITNDGWAVQNINFGNPVWRSNNIVFNLSIGYPF